MVARRWSLSTETCSCDKDHLWLCSTGEKRQFVFIYLRKFRLSLVLNHNLAIEWLEFMVCILEVPGSTRNSADWYFRGFPRSFLAYSWTVFEKWKKKHSFSVIFPTHHSVTYSYSMICIVRLEVPYLLKQELCCQFTLCYVCIWTNKMHKILVIRLYFPLDALHVSDCISPSSGAAVL